MLGLNLNFDVSLLFPLAISLLIGGALFYYFYTRINVLETSVINQGKILQTFISGNITPQTAGSIPENTKNNNLSVNSTEKIDISDDEESDDDDDDDDEDSVEDNQKFNLQNNEDEDDDDDEEDKKNNTKELIIENETTQVNVLNLGSNGGVPTMEILANILQMNQDEEIGNNLTLEETDVIKVIDMNSGNLEEITNEQNLSEDSKKKNKSLNKMNVKELQEIVSKKGLNPNTDISKLKKAELLELISKENSN